MIKRYLFDPNKQFQDNSGKNNVNGFLRVYIDNTDDRSVTYKDFDGTLNEADIRLDNNGRAIVIVDDSKTYRLEVYDSIGKMLWTAKPLYAIGANSGGVSPDDIKPLVLKQFGKNLGTYSPLNGNTITIGDSAVHVAVDHANIHAYLTEILADGRTPVLVMSDTDPDTPGVTRDFYFYPTARTGVDSDYSFIGYDGNVVKVATVHDDDTVTYATHGEFLVDKTPTKNSKNLVESGGVYEDVKDFRNFFVAKYGETAYHEVREALIQNKTVICIKDNKVYTYAFISNSVHEFAGSVDSDGTFNVVKVSSPDVWTTESHNVKEFSVYRKSFDNLHPASATLTATDIENEYIDFDLDLGFPGGWIGSYCGEPTIIIGLPGIPWQGSGKSMLKEVFTKVILYAKSDYPGLIAAAFGNLKMTDDGRSVIDGNVTWNRMFTGIGISLLELQGFTARCYLNQNSSVEWTAGLNVELYIHFTVIL